ncbi:MAG: MarR family transcriptional regulator [Candidatus Nanopelagicales bacterium]
MATSNVVPELRIAVMRLARRLRSERASDAMTPSQMAVLGTLMRQGAMCPADLASTERVQPPSMTRILNTLQESGMVTRTPHPTDGRQVLYEATQEARRMVQEDRERRDHWLSQRLSMLSAEDQRILERSIPILESLALD